MHGAYFNRFPVIKTCSSFPIFCYSDNERINNLLYASFHTGIIIKGQIFNSVIAGSMGLLTFKRF